MRVEQGLVLVLRFPFKSAWRLYVSAEACLCFLKAIMLGGSCHLISVLMASTGPFRKCTWLVCCLLVLARSTNTGGNVIVKTTVWATGGDDDDWVASPMRCGVNVTGPGASPEIVQIWRLRMDGQWSLGYQRNRSAETETNNGVMSELWNRTMVREWRHLRHGRRGWESELVWIPAVGGQYMCVFKGPQTVTAPWTAKVLKEVPSVSIGGTGCLSDGSAVIWWTNVFPSWKEWHMTWNSVSRDGEETTVLTRDLDRDTYESERLKFDRELPTFPMAIKVPAHEHGTYVARAVLVDANNFFARAQDITVRLSLGSDGSGFCPSTQDGKQLIDVRVTDPDDSSLLADSETRVGHTAPTGTDFVTSERPTFHDSVEPPSFGGHLNDGRSQRGPQSHRHFTKPATKSSVRCVPRGVMLFGTVLIIVTYLLNALWVYAEMRDGALQGICTVQKCGCRGEWRGWEWTLK